MCVFDLLGGGLAWLVRLVRPKLIVHSPTRILLLQLDHLGDAVLTTPMLHALRAAYPLARIDVLASTSNRAVFESDPAVDRVIVAERNWFERQRGAWSCTTAVLTLALGLRAQRYDLGIDVRGDVLSVILLALAGVRRRLGWSMGGGGFLLTDVAEWHAGVHEVESRMALLRQLGIAYDALSVRVSVHVSDEDRGTVARWLRNEWTEGKASVRRRSTLAVASGRNSKPSLRIEEESPTRSAAQSPQLDDAESLHAGRFGAAAPLLVVHLGAGTSAKRWPLTHWRNLIQKFLKDGWRVVVVGGPHEASVRLGLPPNPGLRDWTSQLSVAQTTALLERADLFIGADSGPAHLAACASVPSVVLFSGTNRVAQWRPWSRRSLVLKQRVSCQPCHRKICPLADHPCLNAISPVRVYRAAGRWWSRLHHFESPHPC